MTSKTNEITLYSLYDCDDWRSTSSMTPNALVFETISKNSLNNKLKELLTEDNDYREANKAIDTSKDLAAMARDQELNNLYLIAKTINLVTGEVEEVW